MLSKNPRDVTPALSPELAAEMVEWLEHDTARNEYALHAVIHWWLSENPGWRRRT